MPIPPFLKALIISTFLLAQLAAATEFRVELGQPNDDPTSILASSLRNQRLSSDAQEYLNAHNKIRRRKGVPRLHWDGKLAQYAQNWADSRVDECKPHHHSGGPYGENILWEQYDEKTPTQVTQVWNDEEVNYNHDIMACKCQPAETSNCMCGHYTQVVWSTTKFVGCGNVTCNNELGVLIVCSYYPPGNYRNENPFESVRHWFSTMGAHKPRRKRHHRWHGVSMGL